MSKTLIAEIKGNRFPVITIKKETYIVWKNMDSYPHSVETLPDDPNYFNAGPLLPNETSSPIFFPKTAKVQYYCRFHAGMSGTVNVSDSNPENTNNEETEHNHDGSNEHGGGHGHHIKHFHGFVTGGKSSKELFLSHTPVLADPRHHFQVILQASLPDPKHADAYDNLRNSSYGNGKIQIFHDHMSLTDIRDGVITLLPNSAFEYYPTDPEGNLNGEFVPGLEENIPVKIDKIIHFHTFEKSIEYPEALTYIIYGNKDDVFIDHFINRAPSFHSIAKLKFRPEFYSEKFFGSAIKFSIPEKIIKDVSPKQLDRVAFVDNSFHLFWLPPPGVYARSLPQDPLIKRDNSDPIYDVYLEDGMVAKIEIEKYIHFDVRLLNYGVFIL